MSSTKYPIGDITGKRRNTVQLRDYSSMFDRTLLLLLTKYEGEVKLFVEAEGLSRNAFYEWRKKKSLPYSTAIELGKKYKIPAILLCPKESFKFDFFNVDFKAIIEEHYKKDVDTKNYLLSSKTFPKRSDYKW